VPIASGCKPRSTPCALSSPLSRPPSRSCRSNWPQPSKFLQFVKPPPRTSSSRPSRLHLPPGATPGRRQPDIRTPAGAVPARAARLHPHRLLLDACPLRRAPARDRRRTSHRRPASRHLDVPLEIHEHRSHPSWSPIVARRITPPPDLDRARRPRWPRLTTVIAYLKGVCHASFSTIRKFVRDVIA